MNIVAKREDLLKVSVAGPLAGFSLGIVLLLLGFVLPPSDGIGVVVDASVFHESLLAGGLGKWSYLLSFFKLVLSYDPVFGPMHPSIHPLAKNVLGLFMGFVCSDLFIYG